MDPIIPQPEQSQYQVQVPPHKHFLNKKFAITFVILLLLGGGAYAGIWYWQKINNSVCYDCGWPPLDVTYKVYLSNQYGFSIALSDSWKGYTVLNSQWEGRYIAEGKDNEHGSIITLRHPLWTTANPREDMPVMVFTPAQWALIQGDKVDLGAAPMPPSLLGQNSKYVIALPARYNYDFKTGYEEVDQLVHTLKAFEPTGTQ